MPSISTFYGITIYMYFLASEHNPSHIHAYYGEASAILIIATAVKAYIEMNYNICGKLKNSKK